jgi:hypothetical protein
MSPPESNGPLDALLRENDAYVEDQGFTARVMTALPPRRRRSRLRPALLLGATVIGFLLLAWWLPGLRDVFAASPSEELSPNVQLFLVLGALFAAAASLFLGLFAVLRWED